jgi:hypothetical protein
MASLPQNWPDEDDVLSESYKPKGDYSFPEDKMNALLAEGRDEEARVELVHLLQEGVDSGPGIPVTPEFWTELRTELHERAKSRR